MKRIIGEEEDFTSSIRPFNRFSNSPLIPAPACKGARSSARTVYISQRFWHIALCHSGRKTLDNGSFADPGFAGQDWIVLPAPHENVNYLTDFSVSSQHWVDLSLFCSLREVNGVFVKVRRLSPSEHGLLARLA